MRYILLMALALTLGVSAAHAQRLALKDSANEGIQIPTMLPPEPWASIAMAMAEAMEKAAAADSDSITPGATNTWIGYAAINPPFGGSGGCTGPSYTNPAQTDDSGTSAIPCVPLGGQFAGSGGGIGLQFLTGQTPEQCAFRSQDATYNMDTTSIPSLIKGNTSQFTMVNGDVLGGLCSSQSGSYFSSVLGAFGGVFSATIGYPSKLSVAQCNWLLAQCTNQSHCTCTHS